MGLLYCRVGSMLLDSGLVNAEELQKIGSLQKSTGKRIARLVIEEGLVQEEELMNLIEERFNIQRVNLNDYHISSAAIDTITAGLAIQHRVIPLEAKDDHLLLAMSDPLDLNAIDEIEMYTGRTVTPVLSRESAINHLVTQFYSTERQITQPGLKNLAYRNQAAAERSEKGHSEDAPVVQLVNSLINRSVEEGASDIHLEPSEDGLRIRLRTDGVLHDLSGQLPSQAQIVSRIKIMASLDIAEKRLPQDGNFLWNNGNDLVNMRVSTLPTIHGEKVVIRILDRNHIIRPLDQLGFTGDSYDKLMTLLLNQSGMLLVTGPTGCGKTSTLYSALHYLNNPEDNIITVEDPVEYQLKGINQVQVNRRINRTFAGTLRSILRQDPDIIMVGEIRDLETAKITAQAALTGHLVLSTLHTNSAAGAVTRLIDMGLEPYLVSASLVGVIAQRLVRKICRHCSSEYRLSDQERNFYEQYFQQKAPLMSYRGSKCNQCSHTGFNGRTTIQELFILNPEMKDLISAGSGSELLQKQAVLQGMRTLLQDGLRCVQTGITTLEEVVRVTFSSVVEYRKDDITGNIKYLNRFYRNRCNR